eukprot:1143836-Pelagomonas_calceolata.AAC.1
MAASEAAGFVNDLVLWIDFHQSNREPGTRASCDACKLQQLKELGMGLLNHSLCCDLVGIAGITERAAEVMKWLLPGKLTEWQQWGYSTERRSVAQSDGGVKQRLQRKEIEKAMPSQQAACTKERSDRQQQHGPRTLLSRCANRCRHGYWKASPDPPSTLPLRLQSHFCFALPRTCAAGLLLEGLTQPPFHLTFEALASEAFAYKPEFESSQQEPDQAGSNADSAHINAQDLVAAAKHSGSAAVLAQCQAWEAQQANSTPIPSGRPPSRPAALTLWQWVVAMALPFWRFACWACPKMGAAASSALATKSKSSCSNDKGAEARADLAAKAQEYRAWVTAQVSG